MCGNITKTIKNISRTHCNFPGILQEILACTGVQIAGIRVHIARKLKKTERKPKPAGKRPKPKHTGGSGSPGRPRGVGLIRIP